MLTGIKTRSYGGCSVGGAFPIVAKRNAMNSTDTLPLSRYASGAP